MVVVLTGVAGAGKTTVGRLLATELGWRFVEGDELHAPASVAKMARGEPLTDEDRRPWLAALRAAIADLLARGEDAVVTCSALKAAYRDELRVDPARVRFVLLAGDYALIDRRLASREGHFMPRSLLASQFAALEAPGKNEDVLTVHVTGSPEEVVETIRRRLGL
ncbi:MAG TPA: gluconokinase [Thermoanaerobaculia bacterium]|nr:gluconokinase [Thermoanaerobaculia bacterium]